MNEQELKDLKKVHAPTATEEQFRLWISECQRRGAEPVKDVYLQIRKVREWDDTAKAKVWTSKAIYITSVGFLRKIAERSGKYAGQLPSLWIYLDDNGNPTIKSDIPLKRPPFAAQVSVLRTDWNQPLVAIARWDAYVQTYKDGDTEKVNPTWSHRGPEQLEKCAEALALRKAFPEELAGWYVEEEMGKVEEPKIATPRRKKPSTADLDRVAEEEQAKQATGPKATPEEMKEISGKLKAYAEVVGSEPLRQYILNRFHAKTTAGVSQAQWADLLFTLEGRTNEELQTLVNGEKNEVSK